MAGSCGSAHMLLVEDEGGGCGWFSTGWPSSYRVLAQCNKMRICCYRWTCSSSNSIVPLSTPEEEQQEPGSASV